MKTGSEQGSLQEETEGAPKDAPFCFAPRFGHPVGDWF
jgi:hypothetical protein